MAHRTRTDSIPTVAAATVAATVAGALTAVAVPGSALAQDQAADQAADGGMEEMVVTATRRETNLLDTPVAVTAVSQETLVLRNITNVLEIEKLVPNLKVQDQRTLGMGAVQFSMRGVGNTNFTEQGDPNVGFHVDGVYLPRPQAAIALLYDLERVEVLRGPQGTLFGRNSTVGTINVVTAKPQFEEFSGSIEGQYGRFNDQLVRGTLNIPILDNLAVRLTATTIWRPTTSCSTTRASSFPTTPIWCSAIPPTRTMVPAPSTSAATASPLSGSRSRTCGWPRFTRSFPTSRRRPR